MWMWVKKLAVAALKKVGLYALEQGSKAVVKKFEKK